MPKEVILNQILNVLIVIIFNKKEKKKAKQNETTNAESPLTSRKDAGYTT